MSFAAITAALVIGALVERVRFSAMMLFAALWLTIVYAPLAHMVWSSDGLLFKLGAIDFAGGTVVHINAGVAGLVGSAFAGPRIGHLQGSDAAALAGADDGRRGAAVGRLVRVQRRLGARGERACRGGDGQHFGRAGGGRCSAWMALERLVSGKPSMLGGASGAVAGLVAVTPAAGASGPVGAMLLGAAASLVCYGFVGSLKNRLRLDDSLDVFGIHGLGGITGSIGTAIVALPALGGHGGAGYALGHQLVAQLAAVAVAIGWSAAGSALCFGIVRLAAAAAPRPRRRARGPRHRRPWRARLQLLKLAPSGPPQLAIPLRRRLGMVGATNGRPADA